jgi:hypothetical protein
VSSVDLLNVLLQIEPSDDIQEAPEWMPRPAPTVMDLAAETVEQLTTWPRSIGDTVRRAISDAQDPRSDLRARVRAVRDSWTDTVRTVSATPLNRPIGPHRRATGTPPPRHQGGEERARRHPQRRRPRHRHRRDPPVSGAA